MVDRTLEELVGDYKFITNSSGAFQEHPNEPQLKQRLDAYLKEYLIRIAEEEPDNSPNKAALQELAAGLQNVDLVAASNDVITGYLNAATETGSKRLTGHVNKNLDSVLNEIHPGALRDLATTQLDPVAGVGYDDIAELHARYKISRESFELAQKGDERAFALIQRDVAQYGEISPIGQAFLYHLRVNPTILLDFYSGVIGTRRRILAEAIKNKEKNYVKAVLPGTAAERRDKFYIVAGDEAVTKAREEGAQKREEVDAAYKSGVEEVIETASKRARKYAKELPLAA